MSALQLNPQVCISTIGHDIMDMRQNELIP